MVTDRRYAALVREELPELDPAQVLGEPAGRNTAPAIAYAAAAVERPADDVMVVLPADHLVADEAGFRALLRQAGALAAASGPGSGAPALVTLGITPTGPETGYGYIVAAGPRPGGSGALDVARFVEKPIRRRRGRAPGRTRPGRLERRHLRLAPRRDPVRPGRARAGHRRRRRGCGRRDGRRSGLPGPGLRVRCDRSPSTTR